ncbi:MAG: aldo/keto reductase [Myxococcota bacterium]
MSADIPAFLYGTAWKEADTQSLVVLALEAGFTGIDTANQRKHYHEQGAAEGVAEFLRRTGRRRESLFLQSKFTHLGGQDHRLPYDPRAPVGTQVQQSFQSTLEHFATNYLDSLVLHGPSSSTTLTDDDWEAWGAMEALASAGTVKHLGVSNVNARQLEQLLASAQLRPRFVQNRCYARRGWDKEVRQICRAEGLLYQGFSLLTANPEVLEGEIVRRIAKREHLSPAQVVFRFARAVGMIPLTGTRQAEHMRQDLASMEAHLSAAEVAELGG